MKNIAGFLAVSFVAIMVVGTSYAEVKDSNIASVKYVNDKIVPDIEAYKLNKGSKTLVPSINVMEDAITATAGAMLDAKQPISTADYQMGTADGEWQTLTKDQQDALNSGITPDKVKKMVTRSDATKPVGDSSHPVYVDANGVVQEVGIVEEALKATKDGNGKDIADTYLKVPEDNADPARKFVVTDAYGKTVYSTVGGDGIEVGIDESGIATIDASNLKSDLDFVYQKKLTSTGGAPNVKEDGTGNMVTGVTAETPGEVIVHKSNVQIPIGSATATTYATIWVE